jgi:glutaredoxin
MKVTVFSTATCGICHALMGWLDKKGLAYQKVLVDESNDNMTRLMEVSDGAIGVPFTLIEKDDGSKVTIAGFDQKKFEQTLAT